MNSEKNSALNPLDLNKMLYIGFMEQLNYSTWYLVGARYYDAQLGAWISPDAARQFPNLYSYMGNGFNPLNNTDPDGNAPDVNSMNLATDDGMAAAQLPPQEGFFTAAAHGAWDDDTKEFLFAVYDKDANKEIGYTASQYGEYLHKNGWDETKPLWLYTCGAGAFDQGAQALASAFNVRVVAANGYVQMPSTDVSKYQSAGNPFSSTSKYFPLFPQWLTFKPTDNSINFMPSNPSDVTHVVH